MDYRMKTKVHRCPRCRRVVSYKDNPYRPFCSKRCKMVDLGAWLREEYRIAPASRQEPDTTPGIEKERDRRPQ